MPDPAPAPAPAPAPPAPHPWHDWVEAQFAAISADWKLSHTALTLIVLAATLFGFLLDFIPRLFGH